MHPSFAAQHAAQRAAQARTALTLGTARDTAPDTAPDTAWQPRLPGPGLPQDRHARIAARRTFVALKHRFMSAVADVGGQRAEWLRFQVRQAQEPVDLWLLRGMVFDALGREGPATDRTRNELGRVLDSVFPNSGELLPYGVRP